MKLKITLLLMAVIGFSNVEAQCFVEQNGIVAVEAESRTASGWQIETSATPYSGSGYIAWRGPNYFNSPGNGVITYSITINNPGTYRFIWRSKVGIISTTHPNPSSEHNDSWLKIEGSDFFAQSGSSIKYPIGSGKTPVVNGSGGGGWFKIFLSGTTNWTWNTLTSDHDGHFVYATFNSPGTYNVKISGRSNGHFIDRFVMYKESSYSINQAISATACGTPPPPDGGGGDPPPPPPPPPSGGNNPPTVSITSPANGANINTGSNVAVNLNSGDPDGNLTQHEIFVNNTKVDTDGASYSPHVIQNIQPGSYAIRAKVTDSNGATAESTVNITVGSGGNPPPPPPPPPTGGNNPPTVSITSPSEGQNFNVGSTVTVGVSSDDTDGSVTRHQVFVNNALVDTDGANFTPHYIPNISEGSYAIKVTVTDNAGATTSETVNITVGGSTTPPPPPPTTGGNNPPTVNFISPNEGQNFNAGNTVTVNVQGNDTDGSVTRYQIYVNNVLVDTDGSNFTPHYIRNITNGTYAIRATVTDNQGATASATVNITVGGSGTPPPPPPPSGDNNPPTVTITSPSNGQNFSVGSTVTVGVSASDSDGTITRHQVYVNDILVDTDPTNFTPHYITSIAAGSYAIRVTVTDNDGATTSATVNITVGSGGKSAIAYPNPVKQGKVNVKLPETITGVAGYAIISPSGTEVERGTIDASKFGDTKLLQIDSANMKNDGVYYLVIQANYDVFTVPIIKQ